MKALSTLALLLAGNLLLLAPQRVVAAEPSSSPLVVATRSGTLQGRAEKGLNVFRGVPFAAPPLGPLRWRAPQPVAAWSGTRKADAYAASCMQKPGIPLSEGGTDGPLSEDCLYLNVWTPEEPQASDR